MVEHGIAERTFRSRWMRGVPPALLACVLAAYLIRRHHIGLTFPVPWPDEGSFLWQALAFRDRFSLFAPEVNPTREALWMPPGFMVLEGLVFRAVPFSLGAARTLSALFVCGAVACVYACTRRLETRLLFPIFAALFLFCPIACMAGNVARMEGLELFVLALAFYLLERRRGAVLGVLLLAPLVHPNGVFGVAIGLPCYFFRARRGGGTFRRADAAVLAAAVAAWALYAIHVSQHWAFFVRDIGAQLRFKQYVSASDGGALARLGQPVVWGSVLALVAAFFVARRAGNGVGGLGAFAVALLLQTIAASGWLYDVYPAFTVLVASIVAADSAFALLGSSPLAVRSGSTASPNSRGHVAQRVFGRQLNPVELIENVRSGGNRIGRRSIQVGAAVGIAVLVVALVASVYRHNPFLERSLDRATVLRKSSEPAYDTAVDRAAVSRYLTSIVPSPGAAPLAVQFLPDADALLYEKLRGPTFRYVQQTFYDHHYDVLVMHDSVWFPPFVRDLELLKLLYTKGRGYDERVIYQRDGTERWTVYRWKQAL